MTVNEGRAAPGNLGTGASRQLEAALDALGAAGAHAGLLVLGPRGMGKSTLIDDLHERLDGVVVRVRGSRNVPTVPLGAAAAADAAIMASLARSTSGASDDVPAQRGTFLRDGHGAQPLTSTTSTTLEQSVRLAAGRRPLYLLVDDVDHVDTASRMLFASVAARGPDLFSGVVCTTTRELDVPELHDFRRIELRPLTVGEIVDLAQHRRTLTPPGTVAERLLRLTDGRPAVVRELVDQLSEAQLLGNSLVPTGEALGDAAKAAVSDLLECLAPPVRDALHLVVASGTRSTDLVSRVLDSTGSSLEDLVDDHALVSRAGTVRPASTLLERHLHATTTSSVRRHAARAVLESCAGHLDEAQEAFSRSVATSDTPGASSDLVLTLVDHALRLVRTSGSHDAGDRARRLLAAAWPHCTPEVNGALCAAEAQVALYDGYLVDAMAVARGALDSFTRGQGRVALARVVQNASLVVHETVSASLALDTLDRADPAEQREATAFVAETALMLLAVGRPTSARTLAERLDHRRPHLPDEIRAELDYVVARTSSRGSAAEAVNQWSAVRAARQADRGAGSTVTTYGRTPWEAAGLIVHALQQEGEVVSARTVLADLPGTARSRYERLLFELNHASTEFARGNYPLAAHHVEKMSEIADLESCATSLRVAVRVGSAVAGDLEGAPAAYLSASDRASTRARGFGPTLLAVRADTVRGVSFLAAGDSARALEHLERARASWFLDDDERSALPEQLLVLVLPVVLARAYVAAGRLDDARQVSTGCGVLAGGAAWMAAAAQDFVDEVLVTAAGSRVPESERLTRWLTDDRVWRPARDLLRRVVAAPPTTPPATLPRRHPASHAGLPEHPGSPAVPLGVRSVLSDRELEIALLVSGGMRNKEISAQVFLSVRTVEATLTRVFRKLDVRSRTELVSRLGGSLVRDPQDVPR